MWLNKTGTHEIKFWLETITTVRNYYIAIYYNIHAYWLSAGICFADLLTVVSDILARAFNRSGTTRAVVLDIYKAFDRVWHAGLLCKVKSYGISQQICGLISSFLSNRQLCVVMDGKSSPEHQVNVEVP